MQKNRLGPKDSTQKKLIVSDPPGSSYKQNTDGLVWRKPNWAWVEQKCARADPKNHPLIGTLYFSGYHI